MKTREQTHVYESAIVVQRAEMWSWQREERVEFR